MKILLALLCICGAAHAAEIKVLSGNGARAAVAELAERFERASGQKVAIDFAVNPEVKKRIDAGEAFDVEMLNPPGLEELFKEGKERREAGPVRGGHHIW